MQRYDLILTANKGISAMLVIISTNIWDNAGCCFLCLKTLKPINHVRYRTTSYAEMRFESLTASDRFAHINYQ